MFSKAHRQKKGAGMSFPTAVSGFMVLLLSVSVVQGLNEWSVTYSHYPRQICALKGSTVEISGTYTYPASISGEENKPLKRFWFTRKIHEEYNDVETSSNYSGRVKNTCDGNKCTLRITDLRETDSAEYRFRFITNLNRYFGHPGVTLNVTNLQVEVSRSHGRFVLRCFSSCPADTSFIWFKNEQEIKDEKSQIYSPSQVLRTVRYSCAVQGYEEFPSPPVYAPKRPSVSVSPSGEIVEGSSVTLTCSSDANPAANYTWYKEDGSKPRTEGRVFIMTDFRAEHSGDYSCEAQNMLGRQKSTSRLIVVAGGGNSALVAGSVTVVLLVIVLLLAFFWIRKKRSSTESPETEESADTRERGQPEEQEDLQYASIHFPNTRPARPIRHTELQDGSEYAAVKCVSASSTARTRGQESGEDPAALYSSVHKTR